MSHQSLCASKSHGVTCEGSTPLSAVLGPNAMHRVSKRRVYTGLLVTASRAF